LAQAGHSVFLICPWNIRENIDSKGVNIIPFPRTSNRLFRLFKTPLAILKILSPHFVNRVDLIHFHDIDMLPWMTILSLFKPVIYDVHENYPEEMLTREWIPNQFRKFLYHAVRSFQYLCSLIIRNIVLVAESQVKHFDLKKIKLFYLRNYASLSLLADVKQDYMQRPDTIIFTGSAYEANGIFLLLEIAQRVHKGYPNVKFLMADRFDSPLRKSIFVEQINKAGLNGVLELFPNFLPHELMFILNQATIAIAPNLRIPQQEMLAPTKLFEYMAAGLPIVASDLPYASKLFSGREMGILAQPEDPDSFVKAIGKLLSDRTMAWNMGQQGINIYRENYSWESQIPSLISYYARVLDLKNTS